jgi:AbrB family looped-hinge helix DNA binding protein
MTIVQTPEKGQIVVPKDIRDQHGFGNGSAFAVRETKSGALLLRPVQAKGRKDLVDFLLDLKGFQIPEMQFHAAPRR